MFSNINNLNVHVFSRRAVLADLRAQRLIFESLILFTRDNLSLNMSRIKQAFYAYRHTVARLLQ